MKRLKDRILRRKSRIRIICVKDGVRKPWYPSKKTFAWTDWTEDEFHQKEYDEMLKKSEEEFKKDIEQELEKMIRAEVENRYNLKNRITECDEFIVEIDYQDSVIESIYEYIIEVPQDVIDRIERLEGLIVDSKKTIEEYEDMIADILAKKEEDRTVEDKEKLLRLDGYIRAENESIRKFEGEIRRLKLAWNIK